MTRARLILAAVVLFGVGIWGYDLWAPDEPYFAEGAREMVADGHWVVPHVNGVVSTDKPPLFFWLIAVLSLPFQAVGNVTARLPSVLASLGTLLLTLRLGGRLYGPRIAEWSAGVLCVTYLFWDKARTSQTDALLCCLILVAVSAFEAFRSEQSNPRSAGLLFWAAAGLAVLAKGPIGVVLPVGIALITLAWDRKLARLRHFAPLSGPLVFAAIVAAWAVPASLWNPELYSVTDSLREHFVDRAMQGMHHAQPFWYYAKALPPLLFPWTLLVPGALVLAWRGRTASDRLLLVIVVFTVLVFSISTEKRALYVLPSFPAYAILIARLIETALQPQSEGGLSRRWVSLPMGCVAAVFVLLGLGLIGFGGKVEELPRWGTVTLGLLMAAAGGAAAWALARRTLGRAVVTVGAGTAAICLFVALAVFPVFNETKSARAFSEAMVLEIDQAHARGRGVVAFNLRNLPEAFAFYSAGLYTRETNRLEDLEAHLAQPQRVYAVIDADEARKLPDSIRSRMVTVREERLSRKNVALVHNGGGS